MRAASRKRPPRRTRCPPPPGTDLANLAERVSYVGSPEHKAFPSFAGPPKHRGDATKCDPDLEVAQITAWLRAGLLAGHVGAPWEGDFPRYVWLRTEARVYEARLVNQGLGQYKGWALADDEVPSWL